MTALAPPSSRTSRGSRNQRDQEPVDERYRALKAMLEALPGHGPNGPRVLLLASPDSPVECAGDGIARAFAAAGERTMLVNCSDDGFGVEGQVNGSHKIGEDVLAWLVAGEDASLCPALSSPLRGLIRLPLSDRGDLFRTSPLSRLFAWARSDMDRVIVVASPLARSADALLLARQTDAVVLGVRMGQTTRGSVRQARQDLLKAGGRIGGAICLD